MANLLTAPITQIVDGNGEPLVSGKIYTYVSGPSLTPKATYTDSGAGTPLSNPVVLDANGAAEIWLSGAYRMRIYSAADVLLYDVDDINTDASSTTTFTDNTFEIVDNLDATKKIQFQVSSLTTSTTRVYTWPDKDGTVAMTSDIAGAVLLTTQTVGSPAASVDFTSGIDGTYKNYLITCTGMTGSVATANVQCRFRRSGSFLSAANYNSSGSYVIGAGPQSDGQTTGQTVGTLGLGVNLDTTKLLNGEVRLCNTNVSTEQVAFGFFYGDAASLGRSTYTVSYTSTGTIDGFQIYASGGNITGGTFKLYGIP